MKLQDIVDAYPDESFLQADDMEDALIGVDTNQWNHTEGPNMRLVYSASKCIGILMKQGMNRGEAREYFEFNVKGAYVGEQTPIFVEDKF